MRPWPPVRYLAHRCGGRLAPENTLAGAELAAARGYAAVEFDVMLSADATPWLIHDETLQRTTDGVGDVAACSDAELLALYANRGYEAAFPEARLPRLTEIVATCRRLRLGMNVEIKPAAGTDVATARRVAAVLAPLLADAAVPVLISSFSAAALHVARPLLPDLPFAMLVEQVPADWQQRLAALGCSSLHVSRRQAHWDWLAAAHAAAIPVRCYTVNDADEAQQLFGLGVEAVFTDALDLFAGERPATTGNTS
jgi:glycerophosphoryl diester phosphodiesterase